MNNSVTCKKTRGRDEIGKYAYFKSVFLVFHFFRYIIALSRSVRINLFTQKPREVPNQKFSCSGRLVAMDNITSWLTVKFYVQKISFFTPSFWCNKARLFNFGSMIMDPRNWIQQRISKAGKFTLVQFKEHANWKQLSYYRACAVGGLF